MAKFAEQGRQILTDAGLSARGWLVSQLEKSFNFDLEIAKCGQFTIFRPLLVR
jgi:hypothetical protein